MNKNPFFPVIVYRVTDFCNLNCVFCAHARELVRPRCEVAPADVLQLGRVLGNYREKTGNRPLVNWLGGEPLFWKPLTKIVDQYKKLGVDVSATTNGTPLQSRELLTHVAQNYTQLTISIDGFAAFHDKKRGKDGLYDQVSKAVPALAKERDGAGSKLHLRMNTVLMRDNFSQFPELCKTFASWGVNEITYNQLGGRDRPENFQSLRLLPQQVETLERILPDLKADMDQKGVFINTNPDYIARFKAYASDEVIDVKDCKPGTGFFFIDEFSNIAPCNFTVDSYKVPVREIETVEQFEALPERFTQMQQTAQHPACKNCMSTRVSGKFVPVKTLDRR